MREICRNLTEPIDIQGGTNRYAVQDDATITNSHLQDRVDAAIG